MKNKEKKIPWMDIHHISHDIAFFLVILNGLEMYIKSTEFRIIATALSTLLFERLVNTPLRRFVEKKFKG